MSRTVKELLEESHHDFESLVSVMQLLRAPGGCPWDREQTHKSIRADFIEETYEVIEAIDTDDPVLLREELGDVLLQVVFHARISEEAGEFCIDDVVHDITAKLIHRHPHVFADVVAETSDAVLTNWEKIKTEEKNRIGLAGSLSAVPPSLPALMRAQKLVKKAKKTDITPDASILSEKITEAASALAEAMQEGGRDAVSQKIGQLLFLTAAAGQSFGADSEQLLGEECARFTSLLTKMEADLGDFLQLSDEKKQEIAQNAYFFH